MWAKLTFIFIQQLQMQFLEWIVITEVCPNDPIDNK